MNFQVSVSVVRSVGRIFTDMSGIIWLAVREEVVVQWSAGMGRSGNYLDKWFRLSPYLDILMDISKCQCKGGDISPRPREIFEFLRHRSDGLSSHDVQFVLGRAVATTLAA